MIGLGEALSIGCALAWAAAVILFRRSGAALGPFALNLFKNLLALALLLVTIAVVPGTGGHAPAGAVALMLLSGLVGIGIGDTLYLRALERIGAARLGVAGMLYSPFVILLSMLFLGEKLAPLQWLGVALVLGGVALSVHPGHLVPRISASDWPGVRDAIVSMALMAAGIVIAKPLLETWDFLFVVTMRLVGGLLGQFALIAWRGDGARILAAFRGVRHWRDIVLGALLGTYVSMLLWLGGYKYAKASVAAVLNETAAIFILILAAVFLGERLRGPQVAGAALAACGVALVVWP